LRKAKKKQKQSQLTKRRGGKDRSTYDFTEVIKAWLCYEFPRI
jgi:hypothetical protein